MNSWINLTALWEIVVVGLLAGAGLPAIFAIGLRLLNMSGSRMQTAGGVVTGPDSESDRVYGGNPVGLAVGAFCFAIVLAAVGYGIYLIVAGS